MSPVQVLVAQIGARRHYAVPVALFRAGQLAALHTDWCANRGLLRTVTRLSSAAGTNGRLRRLGSRMVPEIPAELIHSHLRFAWGMHRLRRTGISTDAYYTAANAAFGEEIVKQGFGEADAVYTFNAAGLEILEAARERGLATFVDQTMAPWQIIENLLKEERQRWPDWSLPTSEGMSVGPLAEREAREWELADRIICGSQYVADSVSEAGGPFSPCRVVHYGYDHSNVEVAPRDNRRGPLRVLFVGTVDLRKGVPYLLEAANEIDRNAAEFRMVGPIGVTEAAVRRLQERIDVIGPVARSEVHEHYAWADVFVLPTLAEGSANVCFEAMAHGLPVVTTPNAGSVVRDGVEGWIVPIRSSAALAESLHEAQSRQTRLTLSENAVQRSREFTWDRYMQAIVEALDPTTTTVP